MRVTIEDGVYITIVLRREIIRTTDIFRSCGHAGAFGGDSKTSK